MTILHLSVTGGDLEAYAGRYESLWWNGTETRWRDARPSPDFWCLVTADGVRRLLGHPHLASDESYDLVIGVVTRETPNVETIWTDPNVDAVAVIGVDLINYPREFTFGPVSDHGQRTELWRDLVAGVTPSGWMISGEPNVIYQTWSDAITALDIIEEPMMSS